jgi:hypothetical protein
MRSRHDHRGGLYRELFHRGHGETEGHRDARGRHQDGGDVVPRAKALDREVYNIR